MMNRVLRNSLSLLSLATSLFAGIVSAADITSTWNAASATWGNSANWTNAPVTANFPNNGNGGFTYDVVLGNAGTITMDQDITIQRLTLSSGIVTGSFNLVLNENLVWTGGSLVGTGTTNVSGTGSTISGGSGKGLDRVLNNSGIITDGGADSTITFGLTTGATPGVLNNSGTFNVTGGGDFSQGFPNAGHAINNSGAWNVSGTGATSSVNSGIAFNNSGAVTVTGGTLSVNSGGTSNGGAFSVSAGAGLIFSSGSYLAGHGTTFTGSGAATVSSGTFTAGSAATDTVSAENFAISGGTLTGGGTFNVTQALNWTGGAMVGGGTTNVSGTGSTISGASGKGLDRVLNNSGIITDSRADGNFFNFGMNSAATPGVLNNSGTFNVTGGGDFSQGFANAGHAINNSGAWNVSGPGTKSNVNSGIAFNNSGAASVTSGTLALYGGGTSTGGAFSVSAGAGLAFSTGGYLAGHGTTFTGSGATTVSSGTFTAGSAATDTVSAENFAISGGTLTGGGAFNVTQALNWTGGAMVGGGTTNVSGTGSTISGASGKGLDRVLNNSGIITDSRADGNMFAFGMNSAATPGVLNNSGTFNVTGGGDFSQSFPNAGHAINNSGAWNVSGPGTKSNVNTGIAFNNSGAASITSGTLALYGGTSTVGAFSVSAGAGLIFAGDYVAANATTFTGAGVVSVTGGTFTVARDATDSISIENFTIGGGVLTGSGAFNVTQALDWTGGAMIGTGTTNVSGPGSTISLPGNKTLDRVLNNSTTITNSANDSSAISFGYGSGTIPGVLNNSGTFNVTAGCDFSVGIANAGHAINNSGAWNVAGPGITSNVGPGILFNNSGAVSVTSGTLSVRGGGTSTGGAFSVSAGAGLIFSVTDYVAGHGTTFTGSGTATVSSNTFTAGSAATDTVSAENFTIGGGVLTGGGAFNVTQALDWSGGAMIGTGTTNVSGTGSTISLPGNKTLDRVLNNSTTITNSANDSSAISFGYGSGTIPGVINNSGTFNVTAGCDFSVGIANAGHAINNSGAWNVSGPGTKSSVGTGIAFTNSGVMSVTSGTLGMNGSFTQTAGQTVLGGGGITSTGTLNFQGGTLRGSGTVSAAVNNTGATISPGLSPGVLNITGNLTLGGASNLLIELGGTTQGTQYDLLTEGGSVALNLNGTIEVRLINGFASTILPSDTFTIIASNQVPTGMFSNVAGGRVTNADGSGSFQIDVVGNNVMLSAFVPEPGSLLLLGVGCGLLLLRSGRRR